MNQLRKELQVAALCNGTAIDHIPPEVLFKVVSLLGLEKLDNPITIGNNLESKKMPQKGIIKVSDKYFDEDEINKLALIAPNIILNVIKEYEVVEKKRVTLPSSIKSIVKCNNPKCITNNEPMSTSFSVVNNHPVELTCDYCSITINKDDIILK